MDPLESLAKRNAKHERIANKERKEMWVLIPISALLFTIYAVGMFYITSDDLPHKLWGLGKSLWALLMVLLGGTGAAIFVASFSVIVWLHRFNKYLRVKVSMARVSAFTAIFLIVSFLFFIASKYINWLFVEHSYAISKALSFASSDVLGILVFIANMFVVMVAGMGLSIFIFLALLPTLAKKHAAMYRYTRMKRQ